MWAVSSPSLNRIMVSFSYFVRVIFVILSFSCRTAAYDALKSLFVAQIHPALRAADHLGKHHKPPIPHDLGLYRASAAPAEGKLYLQADDRRGELHPAPYLRTDHRGKNGRSAVHEPPLSLPKIQGRNWRKSDGFYPLRKNGGGKTPPPLFR